LSAHAADGGLDHELDHWSGALAGCGSPAETRSNGEPGAPARTVSVQLSAEDTDALLHAAPTAYRTRINDVLLAALAWALSRYTGQNRVSIDLEGHGREEILDGVDLSRTVGWFTTIFPVVLDVPAPDEPDWRGLIKSVRRQLRAIPGNGLGFGALRFLGPPAARSRLAADGSSPQITFNYLGQWDARSPDAGRGLLRNVHAAIGQEQDPADPGPHPLEITGGAEGGRMEFSWSYQPDVFEESTVESVANDFLDGLQRIAQDCRRSLLPEEIR
jgi:non-ribosomal peptide synthase protein (TIGR01720 family)